MVSQEQIVAVEEGLDRKSDDTLFEALVRKGFLERKLVFKALAEEFSMRFVDLDTHLMSLYNRGLISAREAFEKSQSPEDMRKRLEDLGATVEQW